MSEKKTANAAFNRALEAAEEMVAPTPRHVAALLEQAIEDASHPGASSMLCGAQAELLRNSPHNHRGIGGAPGLFLDTAHDLMALGSFDEGLALAVSALADARSSLSPAEWSLLCRMIREVHPIVDLLVRSTLIVAMDRHRRSHPGASAYVVWTRAKRSLPDDADDIVGEAIDAYLLSLPLSQAVAWHENTQIRAFFECFVCLGGWASDDDGNAA